HVLHKFGLQLQSCGRPPAPATCPLAALIDSFATCSLFVNVNVNVNNVTSEHSKKPLYNLKEYRIRVLFTG
ncbi:GH22486, partial [Drosophila grimshawi]